MHKQPRQALFCQGHGSRTFDLHILKTVISKRRHEDFLLTRSFQREHVHLEDLARFHGMIIDIDISLFQTTVLLQQLPMLQGDPRTGSTFHLQAGQAGKVLFEREHIEFVTEFLHRNRRQFFRNPDSRHLLGDQQGSRSFRHLCRSPLAIVESVRVPTVFFQRSVIFVAAVDIIIGIGAGRRAPALVGGDDLGCAVGIAQTQFAEHPGTIAPTGRLEVPDSFGLYVVPAIAQNGSDGVASLF